MPHFLTVSRIHLTENALLCHAAFFDGEPDPPHRKMLFFVMPHFLTVSRIHLTEKCSSLCRRLRSSRARAETSPPREQGARGSFPASPANRQDGRAFMSSARIRIRRRRMTPRFR
jgi:hypothetical protein